MPFETRSEPDPWRQASKAMAQKDTRTGIRICRLRDILVIIPARHAATTLGATLRSVPDQDRPAEVIVVDDGPTGGTAAVAMARRTHGSA